MRALLLVLSLGLLAGAATAGPEARYGAWRSCKMGGGGYLQEVVLCPSDPLRAYADVDVGGLYRSDDGGHRWRMLHGNWPAVPGCYGVRGISVDPRNADVLLAAVGDQWPKDPVGVMLSRDGGDTWKRVLPAAFGGNSNYRWTGFILARHGQKPDVVLAGSLGDGVFRTDDGGETWRPLGLEDTCPTDLRFDHRNPQRVWMCALPFSDWVRGRKASLAGGFYRSDDGGATFRKLSDESPSEIVQDPRDAETLYGIFDGGREVRRSRDAGATWEPFSDGLPIEATRAAGPSEHQFNALAAGPDFILTASSKGTFYRLACGEAKWTRIERAKLEQTYEGQPWYGGAGQFGQALGSITVDPRDPARWFFTDWFAIYRTEDAGKSWALSMDGVEDTVLHCLTQDPSDPGLVHLGMADNGYFRSEDGGERFARVDWRKGISNNIKCISLSPKDPSRLYAVGPREWHWESNQVFVSIDRGLSWTRSPMQGLPDMKEYHCDTIVADPADPFVAYLAVSKEVGAGKGGVYRSVDGGKSWAWMGQGLPEGKEFFAHSIWSIGRELAVAPGGALVCISRSPWQVMRWDAAQSRWIPCPVALKGSPNCVVADPVRPGRLYLAADDLYRSLDGGATWQRIAGGGARHVAIDQAKPERIAAGVADGILLSEDGGDTWRPAGLRLPQRISPLVAFAGERLLAGTNGSGAFWMPLGPAGERPVAARPAAAPQAAAAPTRSLLPNGDVSEGTAGWSTWAGTGKVTLSRDTQIFHDGPASLCLASAGGPAKASASADLSAAPESVAASGWVRTEGALTECLVAIQCFDAAWKQIGWVHLCDAKGVREWKRFAEEVPLPGGTLHARLIVTLHGEGKVWLDTVAARTTARPAVFR